MSSGLHVHSKELAFAQRGTGLSADDRRCSKHHGSAPAAGGGFVGGRWYCHRCKPHRKVDNSAAQPKAATTKWIMAVHGYCMETKQGITPSEATELFGTPPTSSSSGLLLNTAMRDGWFRREEWREQGAVNEVRRGRYFAIDKANQPSRKPDTRSSYFDGITRVRSVFELGGTL